MSEQTHHLVTSRNNIPFTIYETHTEIGDNYVVWESHARLPSLSAPYFALSNEDTGSYHEIIWGFDTEDEFRLDIERNSLAYYTLSIHNTTMMADKVVELCELIVDTLGFDNPASGGILPTLPIPPIPADWFSDGSINLPL